MKSYAAQKADQALEELLKDAPLEERLTNAWVHLNIADNEHFVEDANEVREALREIKGAFASDDQEAKATSIRRAIAAILEEFGASEALRHICDDR